MAAFSCGSCKYSKPAGSVLISEIFLLF